MGSITVTLTSCYASLDSAALLMLKFHQIYLLNWIKSNRRSALTTYSDASPYEVTEYSVKRMLPRQNVFLPGRGDAAALAAHLPRVDRQVRPDRRLEPDSLPLGRKLASWKCRNAVLQLPSSSWIVRFKCVSTRPFAFFLIIFSLDRRTYARRSLVPTYIPMYIKVWNKYKQK